MNMITTKDIMLLNIIRNEAMIEADNREYVWGYFKRFMKMRIRLDV